MRHPVWNVDLRRRGPLGNKIPFLPRPQNLNNLRIPRRVIHADLIYILPMDLITDGIVRIRLKFVEKHFLALVPHLKSEELNLPTCHIALIRPDDRSLPGRRIELRRFLAVILWPPNFPFLKSPINVARKSSGCLCRSVHFFSALIGSSRNKFDFNASAWRQFSPQCH